MNFHEYQAKQLLAEYGIPVPAGKVAADGRGVRVAQAAGVASTGGGVVGRCVGVARDRLLNARLEVREYLPYGVGGQDVRGRR